MSFIWNWFGSKTELEIFELAKTNFVNYLVKQVQSQNDLAILKRKEYLLLVLEQIRNLNRKEIFTLNQKEWLEILTFYKHDTPVLLELLITFADELIDLNTEWEDFVAGKQIPHPFCINMEVIYKLVDQIKPSGLISRFDFHKFWSNNKNFISYLKDICVIERITISVEEIELAKNKLRFTTVQKREKKNPLGEEIEKTKRTLRKRNHD